MYSIFFRANTVNILFITLCEEKKHITSKRNTTTTGLFIIGKMAVSVLMVSAVFLLSVSEVISQCPPSSGKTLDVYNNNCIGFYRYLPDV